MDLLLHIGLGKAGSSTLQSNLFEQIPSYLQGKLFNEKLQGTAGDQEILLWLATNHHLIRNKKMVRKRTAAYLDTVERVADNLNIERSYLLYSREMLTMWKTKFTHGSCRPILTSPKNFNRGKRIRPWPVASYIQNYLVPAWNRGQVKVLLTLRAQQTWLASVYAQNSHRILGASQHDFEHQIEQMIDREDPYIKWMGLLEDLSTAIGPDNLHVVLLEDLKYQPNEYWGQIAGFLQENIPFETHPEKAIPARIKKSDEEDTWPLRSVGPILKREFEELTYWRNKNSFVTYAKKALGRIEKELYSSFLEKLIFERDEYIYLSENLTRQILYYVKDDNARICNYLGRDITEFGY